MTDLAAADYFSDPALAQDPYEYMLGVPEEDRAEFRLALGAGKQPGSRVGALDGEPLGALHRRTAA